MSKAGNIKSNSERAPQDYTKQGGDCSVRFHLPNVDKQTAECDPRDEEERQRWIVAVAS